MFRKCKLIFDLPFENVHVKVDESLVVSDSLYFDILGYEEYLEEARILCRKYKSDIQKLMKLYDIESEYELLLGESNQLGYGKKEEEKDQLIVACVIFKEIRQSLRREFFKPFEAEMELAGTMELETDEDGLVESLMENMEQYGQSYRDTYSLFDHDSANLGLNLRSEEKRLF